MYSLYLSLYLLFEKLYWLGTESGLLGAFGFEGVYTAGDGSSDPPTRSMGVGFCNFSVMQWNTTTPLPQALLQECLESHDDHIDLLYLTDSETSLQAIHKWIGGGAKLNLSKSTDTDVLKSIILKLQRRAKTGATTQ